MRQRALLHKQSITSFNSIVTYRMKISDIFVDISLIYPISVIFNKILAMTDISPIYQF